MRCRLMCKSERSNDVADMAAQITHMLDTCMSSKCMHACIMHDKRWQVYAKTLSAMRRTLGSGYGRQHLGP